MEAPVKVVCLCGQETYNTAGWCGACLKRMGPMHKDVDVRIPRPWKPAEEQAETTCFACGEPGVKDKAIDQRYQCAPCETTWSTKLADSLRRGSHTFYSTRAADDELVAVSYLDHSQGHYPTP